MAKYEVTYSYTTYAVVKVEAENKEEALEKAAYVNIDEQLVNNASYDNKPYVELIEGN